MLVYRPLATVKVGVEVNWLADEVGPVANWLVLGETERSPALMVGTSSDRIGTPDGQSYYATLSKSFERETGLPLAPYAGVSWSEHDERFLFPFGVAATLGERASAMLIYDGVHTHLAASVAWKHFTFTLLAVRRREIGISVAAAF